MLGFHSSGIYNGVLSSIYSDADILLAIATAASGEERKSRRRRRRRQQTGRLQMRWALPDKCSRCRDRDLEEETVADRVRQGERARQRDRETRRSSQKPFKLHLDPLVDLRDTQRICQHTNLNSTQVNSFQLITSQISSQQQPHKGTAPSWHSKAIE